MKGLQSAATILLLGVSVSSGSVAAATYNVSDAAGNCGPANGPGGHGLWTNGDFWGTGTGTCPSYFNITGTLTVDDVADTAHLVASAVNQNSVFAELDLIFSNTTGSAIYKQENGAPLPIGDLEIYSDVSGTITFDGSDVVSIGFPTQYGFQIGTGANAKDPNVFGAAAWLVPTWSGAQLAGHWDININLTPVPIPAAAPLFASALGLVGVMGWRKKRKTTA